MIIEDGVLAPPQDSKTIELTFMAETADAEALQPHTPMEAKCSPNKPPKEPNKKPAISEVHPIVQGPCQTGGLNIDDPKPLLALPPLIDLAPTSVIECTTTYDVPYCRAINTSTWATLATHLDTTFSDMNSSMAVDWHATSGHAFFIDNGAICWPLRWQADTSSTNLKNNNIAAMHGGKEVLYPYSPTLDTSGSLKTLTTLFSHIYPPLTFTHDHQYHPLDHAY
jgi:hypothetical protein